MKLIRTCTYAIATARGALWNSAQIDLKVQVLSFDQCRAYSTPFGVYMWFTYRGAARGQWMLCIDKINTGGSSTTQKCDAMNHVQIGVSCTFYRWFSNQWSSLTNSFFEILILWLTWTPINRSTDLFRKREIKDKHIRWQINTTSCQIFHRFSNACGQSKTSHDVLWLTIQTSLDNTH